MAELPKNCRSCGQPMRWVTTAATGKAMPLDPEPDPAGNVVLSSDLLGGASAQVLGAGEAFGARERGETLYMAHHATCPQGDRWRR